ALQFLRGEHRLLHGLSDPLGLPSHSTRSAMRLAGAALSFLVAMSFAAAEPAKQAAPAKAAPAKKAAKSKAPAKADKKAALDAIVASYAAIPLAGRISIQNDLIWTGDYK